MSVIPAQLIDNHTREVVNVVLHTDLSREQVLRVEQVWGPARVAAALRLLSEGARWEDLPDHAHWNWMNKLSEFDPTIHRLIGIECAGEMQGLMRVTKSGHDARLDPDAGKSLVYVEFLESAPWNTRSFTASPRYKGAGSRLIEAAVRWSIEVGFDGRIGLHALPQAEGFYIRACGMTSLGPDPTWANLAYLEMTVDMAVRVLKGVLQP